MWSGCDERPAGCADIATRLTAFCVVLTDTKAIHHHAGDDHSHPHLRHIIKVLAGPHEPLHPAPCTPYGLQLIITFYMPHLSPPLFSHILVHRRNAGIYLASNMILIILRNCDSVVLWGQPPAWCRPTSPFVPQIGKNCTISAAVGCNWAVEAWFSSSSQCVASM